METLNSPHEIQFGISYLSNGTYQFYFFFIEKNTFIPPDKITN